VSQSVARALDLLELVARGVGTLDALSEELGVHKSTVLRLLQTLESRGFAGHDAAHRYHVGPAVFSLASNALEAVDARAAAAPILHELAAATGQTVHLATYQDGIVTYVDKVDSRQGLRMYSRIGLPAPVHATAVGKVLLGGLEVDERERIVAGLDLPAFTPRTHVTASALLADVAISAERGWAEDHEEHETFMNCVGAPIRGADGRIAAAVSISVPNVVLPHDGVLALLPSLLDATSRISAELGAPAMPADAYSSSDPAPAKGIS
jgi:DNA-binding IclR family transcriptional regulator